MQKVLSARPASLGISIRCPHCSFGSRYDISWLEDAIKFGESIRCSACNKPFVIKAHRQKHDGEHNVQPTEAGRTDPVNGASDKTDTDKSADARPASAG